MTALERQLGYSFKDRALLERALTHRSHSAGHNERLEFLGDSVLNCVVAHMLYERFDTIDEGSLSRWRASLVRQSTLAELAASLHLAQHLWLGEGELRSGGAKRPSILADALEAVLGAVFVDSGFDAAAQVVRRLYDPVLQRVQPESLGKDPKTQLQEFLQARRMPLPQYLVSAVHGAAHDQSFEVVCQIDPAGIEARGAGSSRRLAEQDAAAKALLDLESRADWRDPKRVRRLFGVRSSVANS